MKYSSVSGCLFYYDRVLYRWQIAEPTLLFLLGFESVLSYEFAVSDKLQLSKYLRHSQNDTLEPLHYFNIYDDLYKYLSDLGTLEDYEAYIQFTCYGLKMSLNELTGTNTHRTVPLIFKNGINEKLIKLDKPMYRFTGDQNSILDIQAQKIIDIFEDADFDGELVPYPEDVTDEQKEYIDILNMKIQERIDNKNIYKYLDYKAMYSYAFGVIYGCITLGYTPNKPLYGDPDVWYNGELRNLVRTAWHVYNFHYRNSLLAEDKHYSNIQYNKLVNFENIPEEIPYIRPDELHCYVLGKSLDDNEIIKLNSFYSPSVVVDESIKGAFNNNFCMEWYSVDSLLVSDTSSCGIIKFDDMLITKYLLDKPLSMHKAYTYTKDELTITLAPVIDGVQTTHFVTTDLLGWLPLDDSYTSLTYSPTKLDTTKDADKIGYAVVLNDRSVVSYYNAGSIIGILPEITYDYTDYSYISQGNVGSVVSNSEFSNNYYNIGTLDEVTVGRLYFLSDYKQIIKNLSGDKFFDVVSLSFEPLSGIYNRGFSDIPSILHVFYDDALVASQWHTTGLSYWEVSDTAHPWIDYETFKLRGLYHVLSSIELYRGENLINGITTNYGRALEPTKTFVYNYNYIPEIPNGFVDIDVLNTSLGITASKCLFVKYDDYGNELVDSDGNYVVWMSNSTPVKYWNGLNGINEWTLTKPYLSNATAYNTSTNQKTQIIDDLSNHTIKVSGILRSYTDFYGLPPYKNGIIRNTSTDILKVLNTSISGSTIENIYYDSYIDRYCVPLKTSEWQTRSSISSLGYRFVDGTEILYNGSDEGTSVVYDDDNTD